MSCGYEEELTAFVDGELKELQHKQVESHLAACAECAGTVALLKRTMESLGQLPQLQPSVGLRRQMLNRLDHLPPTLSDRLRSLLRPAVWVPAAGLATAAAVVMVVSLQGAGPTPAVEEPEQLLVAMNMDVLDDLEVLGLESPDDLELVSQLHELEASP